VRQIAACDRARLTHGLAFSAVAHVAQAQKTAASPGRLRKDRIGKVTALMP
jgi:hypothetical protein